MNLHAALVHVTSVSSVLHRMRLNKTSLLNSYSSFMFNCLFAENIGCNSQILFFILKYLCGVHL